MIYKLHYLNQSGKVESKLSFYIVKNECINTIIKSNWILNNKEMNRFPV